MYVCRWPRSEHQAAARTYLPGSVPRTASRTRPARPRRRPEAQGATHKFPAARADAVATRRPTRRAPFRAHCRHQRNRRRARSAVLRHRLRRRHGQSVGLHAPREKRDEQVAADVPARREDQERLHPRALALRRERFDKRISLDTPGRRQSLRPDPTLQQGAPRSSIHCRWGRSRDLSREFQHRYVRRSRRFRNILGCRLFDIRPQTRPCTSFSAQLSPPS